MTILHVKQDRYIYRFCATLDGPMVNPPDCLENPSTGCRLSSMEARFTKCLATHDQGKRTSPTNSKNSATVLIGLSLMWRYNFENNR